jgi:hypothetical protein
MRFAEASFFFYFVLRGRLGAGQWPLPHDLQQSRPARLEPMPEPVITHFAPSPTGFLLIGGARAALFN